MNIHKNARLTFARRLEMVQDVIEGLYAGRERRPRTASACRPRVNGWVATWPKAKRVCATAPRARSAVPRAIAPAKALAIVELRRRRLTQARIAASLGVSKSTVGRVLTRAGLSRLSDLEPAEPVVRYEHEAPGI